MPWISILKAGDTIADFAQTPESSSYGQQDNDLEDGFNRTAPDFSGMVEAIAAYPAS